MKKSLNELLKIDGALEINEIFKLRHTTKDYDGKAVDWLYLETKSINGGTRYYKSVEIVARDAQGIINEVNAGIKNTMNEIQEEMRRRWNGGLVGRIEEK